MHLTCPSNLYNLAAVWQKHVAKTLPYLNWLIQQMYQMSISTFQVITLHIFTLIFPAPSFADKNGQIRDFLHFEKHCCPYTGYCQGICQKDETV